MKVWHYGRVVQLVDTRVLRTFKCGFDSHLSYGTLAQLVDAASSSLAQLQVRLLCVPLNYNFMEMANEFVCSDCGGDGTRCRCHEKRRHVPYIPEDVLREERIKELEREAENNLRKLREMSDEA